jgi:teichuronic acid biosynthesis protein TuaE
MKKLLYILVLSSLIGARVLSIDMKIFQLSIYRTIIVLIPFILMYLGKKRTIKILPSGKSRTIVLFYIFWVIYSVISVLWVKDYYAWGKAVYFITSGMLVVVYIVMFIREKKDFVTIFNIFQIMVILHNVIAWFEIITVDFTYLDYPRLDYFIFVFKLGRQPVSMMGNTNNFALLLVLGMFISFICYKSSKSLLPKIISIASIVSSIGLLVKTNSRANILGLIMALGIFLLLTLIKRKKTKEFLLIVGSISIFVGIFVGIVMPTVFHNILGGLNKVLYFDFSGTDSARLNLIKNGIVFLGQTFGFGTGAGNIEYWMANRSIYDTSQIVNMHNWWMELLTGYGVFVFVGYIWMYVTLAKGFFTAYMHNGDEFIQTAAIGLLCCMVAFLMGGNGTSSNITQEWLWVFWAVVVGTYYYIECKMVDL